jgi:predicted metal-dependent phosphoesterase TrpH
VKSGQGREFFVRQQGNSGARWLKAEMHSHCSLDPHDYRICGYSPEELIMEAARLRYDVLAITCHDRDVWNRELAEFAESMGITLIPGMEVMVAGRYHTLVYNFHSGPENLDSFEKIRAARTEDTLVVAPHPFFPASTCLKRLLRKNLDVFDAIEWSGFHTRWLDFNRRGRGLAREHQKPMVGNSDVHFLWQLGRTFSWIHAEPGVSSVLRAIKDGRVEVEAHPLSHMEVSRWWGSALWRTVFPANSFPGSAVGSIISDNT